MDIAVTDSDTARIAVTRTEPDTQHRLVVHHGHEFARFRGLGRSDPYLDEVVYLLDLAAHD